MKTLSQIQVTSPSRTAILRRIFENLQHATVSKLGSPDYAAGRVSYLFKAQALIELLEVHDCGSIGGFDPEMRRINADGPPGFYDRFVWLVNKYKLTKEVEAGQRITIAKLRQAYE